MSEPTSPSPTVAAAGTLPELFAEVPEPFRDAFDPDAPWALLGEPLDAVLAAIGSSAIDVPVTPDFHLLGDGIAIGAGTRILPGAVIAGPVWIGRDVEIRPGSYIRGGCWIGDGCVVGASTEVKRGILFPGAHAPHLNYVGDSVLGRDVNLGAGTVLSNFRHDGKDIAVPTGDGGKLATGRRKFGAVLGDRVLTGCNSVLHPGCVVGRETQIYPGVMLRNGVYPARRMIKLKQGIEELEIS
jgi:UDP-N-acetylglucosamine diphosphorylase / glucose-1-phosphate thymidylyltransferase / UDP-N-acetylgalactosamine diphosphorylase / glucosamine-1-phosphate N-acetyltransferase / galactosamine-1-phosphate N-acetyltransferase